MLRLPPINQHRNLQGNSLKSRKRSATSFSPKSQTSARQPNLPIEMTFDRRKSISGLPGVSEQLENDEEKIAIALSHLDISQRKSENQTGHGAERYKIAMTRNKIVKGPKSVNRQSVKEANVLQQSSPSQNQGLGPMLATDEMSLNDGDLNVMNNLKGEAHEGKSQGQVTNYTGFFQNNISNDLLRKQNGSVQDENITIEGANRRMSNPSEFD